MDTHGTSDADRAWQMVDEGWGRLAVDFATLGEPSNCREYVAVHHAMDVQRGDRLLDVACGSGLAIELARLRGAICAGIDASPRLIAVAMDRNPDSDIRVGDMHAMPWDDDTFDVVTSFRGIWGTTPEALDEVLRVLAPGGRLGLTVWGHIKASQGAWALAPFRLADDPQVRHQADMVALGRPGAGEELLARFGFTDVERIAVPCVWEYADPATYARAIASTGPAFEAIQAAGEAAFTEHAIELATERVRDGLPLRAQIDLVGYVARKPGASASTGSRADVTASIEPSRTFLAVPATTAAIQKTYDDDMAELGFVMNASRLWAYQPDSHEALFAILGDAVRAGSLTFRQRGILVSACAAAMGDSYCSLAWGGKLAGEAGAEVAGAVLRGHDDGLDDAERALAGWARKVARDPNAVTSGDVAVLGDAGFTDAQIFAITLFVSLRIAFSTVNDALGARPDRELSDSVPVEVRDAVTFGRPVANP